MRKTTIPSDHIQISRYLSNIDSVMEALCRVEKSILKSIGFFILYLMSLSFSSASSIIGNDSLANSLNTKFLFADPVLDLNFYTAGVDNEVQWRVPSNFINPLFKVPTISSDTGTILSASIDLRES